MADLVAGIGQLVDEEEPPEAVLASPSGEADERHRGEGERAIWAGTW